MKSFQTDERQTVPASTGSRNLVIENTENREENFHGMRFQGRLLSNPGSNFGGGYISLMCIPNDQITIPDLNSEATLNDSNSFIIAVMPYVLDPVASGSENRYGGVFDFVIAPKTSRTCMKGGKIVGQVTNQSTGAIVLSTMLSMFRTIT